MLRRLQAQVGVRYILWTMRSGQELDDAVALDLWGINENPQQRRTGWATSPKAFAQLYIDDAALGCPRTPEGYADWEAITHMLELRYAVGLSHASTTPPPSRTPAENQATLKSLTDKARDLSGLR